jgi:hypothetical protein
MFCKIADELSCCFGCDKFDTTGSAITNGREPRSCLGRVFNSKLGCIATVGSNCMVCMQPLLKLKTWPKACPVSYSLSMDTIIATTLDTLLWYLGPT